MNVQRPKEYEMGSTDDLQQPRGNIIPGRIPRISETRIQLTIEESATKSDATNTNDDGLANTGDPLNIITKNTTVTSVKTAIRKTFHQIYKNKIMKNRITNRSFEV